MFSRTPPPFGRYIYTQDIYGSILTRLRKVFEGGWMLILQFFEAGGCLAYAGLHGGGNVGGLEHGAVPDAGVAQA